MVAFETFPVFLYKKIQLYGLKCDEKSQNTEKRKSLDVISKNI